MSVNILVNEDYYWTMCLMSGLFVCLFVYMAVKNNVFMACFLFASCMESQGKHNRDSFLPDEGCSSWDKSPYAATEGFNLIQ